MKIDKDELRHECTLIGLNEIYTALVLLGKIDIDIARQFQSGDEFRAAMDLAASNVYHLFED